MLGAASAQMLLDDEQDWQEVGGHQTLTENMLHVDVDSVASAVCCVPLHDRLRIEKEAFTVRSGNESMRDTVI
jgi:hypothetical protein